MVIWTEAFFSPTIPVSYTLCLHTSSKMQEFWKQKCPCLHKLCLCLETRAANRWEGWEEKTWAKGAGSHSAELWGPFDTQWQASACNHVTTTSTIQNSRQLSYGCEVTVCSHVLHTFQHCQLLEATRGATNWRNNRGAEHTVASERMNRR